MTEIEALLSVDAGRTPPDTLAFFLDDGTRGFRRVPALLSVATGLAALACGLNGCGRHAVAALLLVAAMLALRAMPTLRDDANRDPKRQVLVITAVGLIVRDASGLRRWQFEDLTDVVAGIHDSRPFLNLIDCAGTRHTIECAVYGRGERVRRVLSSRLSLSRTPHGG
jgi:hypothetical protein